MTKLFYAFSGDPITYGHGNIVERIRKMHPNDELVVGIGANPDKKYVFDLDEREEMAHRYLSGMGVKVVSFEGMLTDYALENGFDVVYRGIRDTNDVRDELNLFYASRTQNTDMEMCLIPACAEMAHISSSNVKAIAKEHGMIHTLVPLHVKEAIDSKMLGQCIVGITGISGAGKTHLGGELKKLARELGIPAYHINIDALCHQILDESTEGLYVKTRQGIICDFKDLEDVMLPGSDNFIDKKILGNIVFGQHDQMEKLDGRMRKPMLVKITREKYGNDKKGLILIDGALIAEFGLTYVSNNNVILVDVDKITQEKRLLSKGLDHDQIRRRKESQYTTERKRLEILKRISDDKNGHLWEIDNSDDANQYLADCLKDIILKLDHYGELRFRGLWNRIGADGMPDGEYKRLVDAYSEPHRYHHTLGWHIIDGLNELWKIRPLLEKPDEVEFAWWFHDYSYRKQSKVNEKRSAQAAYSSCMGAMIRKEFAEDIQMFILDTGHNEVPKTSDGKFIADIDILIFGKQPEVFDEYERRIRKEYLWVDKDEYNAGRSAILQRFLNRPRIYHTNTFQRKYEGQARENLERSLLRMTDQSVQKNKSEE
jgi:pantetheine-phosphate adenylyltransferase